MLKTITILGRQPALGIAELESLYGADQIQPYGSSACFINLDSTEIDFNRLGGTMRLGKVLVELPNTNWKDIEKYLLDFGPGHAATIDGKLSFGISVFGLPIPARKIASTALALKKVIKQAGNSVRMVPHNDVSLGSAQVLYNKLTAKNGWELLVVSDGKTAYLAQTTRIQDIDAYSARDQARPHRDAKVGMLPPKLAQIIINLGVGQLEDNGSKSLDLRSYGTDSKIQNPRSKICVLDPFCGTGVVCQEAMLMDYDIYGSDLEPRMVQYTIDNLAWLDTKYPNVGDYRRIEIGDATNHVWNFSQLETRKSRLVIAGETYLGQPLSTLPNGEHLSKIIYEVNLLHHKFLENIGKQIKPGTRLCLAVPTWRGRHEFLHLPTLDHLTDIGYTRTRFEYVSDEDLIYHRDGQIVGRELLIIVKN
jgi:tRNA G10  N-methylase Trm11